MGCADSPSVLTLGSGASYLMYADGRAHSDDASHFSGRGNMYILNMPPNTTGVIPEYLTNETAQLGKAVEASFAPASALSRLVNQTVQCGPGAPALLLPPPQGGGTFAFDAVVLEEDIGKGNQRIAGYALQTCTEPAGACNGAQWVTVTGVNATQKQTVTLGVTVGRKVIERGFNGQDGVPIAVTGLRFKCTAAFPAGTTTAYLKSFSVHKIQAPKGWPRGPRCQAFNCTCKGMASALLSFYPPPPPLQPLCLSTLADTAGIVYISTPAGTSTAPSSQWSGAVLLIFIFHADT